MTTVGNRSPQKQPVAICLPVPSPTVVITGTLYLCWPLGQPQLHFSSRIRYGGRGRSISLQLSIFLPHIVTGQWHQRLTCADLQQLWGSSLGPRVCKADNRLHCLPKPALFSFSTIWDDSELELCLTGQGENYSCHPELCETHASQGHI